MLDQDLHVSSVCWLKDHLKESNGIEVKNWVLRDIMRAELDLRYKRIKEMSWQGNCDRNKILRQQFAMNLLELDFSKKTVLNIDETWLGVADFRRYKWCRHGENNSGAIKQVKPRITLIVGLDTEG